MTVSVSLQVSCWTIFIRQGISLHYNPQDKTSIYLSLWKNFHFFC